MYEGKYFRLRTFTYHYKKKRVKLISMALRDAFGKFRRTCKKQGKGKKHPISS